MAVGFAVATLSTGGVAYAGHAYGVAGQACAASYDFAHLGQGLHAVQQLNGNNAGGVRAALAEFCP